MQDDFLSLYPKLSSDLVLTTFSSFLQYGCKIMLCNIYFWACSVLVVSEIRADVLVYCMATIIICMVQEGVHACV